MLLVVTGAIQTGKTSWLAGVVKRLEAAGVAVEGVVSPGVWRRLEPGDEGYGKASPALGAQGATGARYEKLGIDALLLPQRERFAFARRVDLARAEGSYDPKSQAARNDLSWHIDDRAIDRVNAHFAGLAGEAAPAGRKRLLVVDELGRLEVLAGSGLTSAVDMVARGPQGRYDAALVVARTTFGIADLVCERYADAWGGCVRMEPTETAWERWLAPLAG